MLRADSAEQRGAAALQTAERRSRPADLTEDGRDRAQRRLRDLDNGREDCRPAHRGRQEDADRAAGRADPTAQWLAADSAGAVRGAAHRGRQEDADREAGRADPTAQQLGAAGGGQRRGGAGRSGWRVGENRDDGRGEKGESRDGG